MNVHNITPDSQLLSSATPTCTSAAMAFAPPLQPQEVDQQYFHLHFLNSERLHRKSHLQLSGSGLAPPLQPAQIDTQ